MAPKKQICLSITSYLFGISKIVHPNKKKYESKTY
jgi:hypothetical protein